MNAEQPVAAPTADVNRAGDVAPARQEPTYTVHFAFDSADVRPDDATAVAERLPTPSQLPVTVVGYTDAVGPLPYNEDLARRRAQAVANLLVSLGTSQNAITARGRGGCCYLAPNDTATDRARNRRAEIFAGTSTSSPGRAPAPSRTD